MAVRVSDWASLPRNLVDLIVDNLIEFPNFIRFSSVCKSWRSIALSHQSQRFLPMLITHCSDNNRHILCRMTEKLVYKIQMPLTCDGRFCGSSHGWLLMVDKSLDITLVNPFLNKTLVLPNFGGLLFDKLDRAKFKPDRLLYFIKKAILLPQTQNQGGNNFPVLVIYGEMGKLAYLESRNAPWKSIMVKEELKFLDIICYKGEVFAVTYGGELVGVNVETGAYEIVIKSTEFLPWDPYLVESQDGDILLLERLWAIDSLFDTCLTKIFRVYKVSWEQAGKSKWVRIKNIGEQALFVGVNENLSVSTRDFPQYKSNSIYYVDDYVVSRNEDMQRKDYFSGIYNIEDNSFSSHYKQDPYCCRSLPPIWIVPNLTEFKCTSLSSDCGKIS